MKTARLLLLSIFVAASAQLSAQVTLSAKPDRNAFPLVKGTAATIYYDKADAEVVAVAAGLFAQDIQSVTGKKPSLATQLPRRADHLVVVGTLGASEAIDKLAAQKKIDPSAIAGGWEQYIIKIVDNPFPGVKKALVVAGCDRRGTAYGLFSVSEAIGVSPWYWWADVPAKKHKELLLSVRDFTSRKPSVKYRGIFINDEDWGLLPWATKTFEPEAGTIGPRTYAKVCELLLRLKANYLCPAMHTRSVAFNQIPENKVVADRYGIVMGSVHCEPLLYNNAREWDKKTMGDWNYETNKATINRVLRQRVEENSPYENVYTLALRGLHDKAMEGDRNFEERKRTLEEALDDQRRILSDIIKKPLTEIPQAFTPYKEVMDIYSKGMALPDEVTIIWPDDNFGYMKRLSNPREQKRSGRSGVYYHISYQGKPHDYLWLYSTPPNLMYEELDKAYRTGGDGVWLLNVGDIKPCEFGIDLFLAMAYDFEGYDFDKVASSHARWLASIFGQEHYKRFDYLTREYYRLAFSSKPEYMGWGYEWNTRYNKKENVTDTEYSFANYNEADDRIADYIRLGRCAVELMDAIEGEELRAAFFQLVYYPVKGAELMNRKMLAAQQNRLFVSQGRAGAMELAAQSLAMYDSLDLITDQYHQLLDGKWARVVNMSQGSMTTYDKYPTLDTLALPKGASLGVIVQGEDVPRGVSSYHLLPAFSKYFPDAVYWIDVFSRGDGAMAWSLEASHPWIKANKTSGTTTTGERIAVSVDWSKVPAGDKVAGSIVVKSGSSTENVLVSVFNPASPSAGELAGLFVENNGCIVMNAVDFNRKVENDQIQMTIIDNLGFEDKCVRLGDALAKEQDLHDLVPCLEYDFWSFSQGAVDVYIYMLPTFPLYPKEEFGNEYGGHDASNTELRYGVSIDDVVVMSPTISNQEYSQAWSDGVRKNCSIKKVSLNVRRPGKHTLKVFCGDPGVVLQKVVVDFGGMKRSYTGPESTKVAAK